MAADLTAIAALAGTSGLLKKTAADTWTLDTAAYTTNLGTVTGVTGTAPIVQRSGCGFASAPCARDVENAHRLVCAVPNAVQLGRLAENAGSHAHRAWPHARARL